MDEEDGWNLLDETGNTTLHLTAKDDTLKALELAVNENPYLMFVLNSDGYSPLDVAIL